ncbi:hypothetical protein ACFL54_09465, partial [Planctomycetota bacterium]
VLTTFLQGELLDRVSSEMKVTQVQADRAWLEIRGVVEVLAGKLIQQPENDKNLFKLERDSAYYQRQFDEGKKALAPVINDWGLVDLKRNAESRLYNLTLLLNEANGKIAIFFANLDDKFFVKLDQYIVKEFLKPGFEFLNAVKWFEMAGKDFAGASEEFLHEFGKNYQPLQSELFLGRAGDRIKDLKAQYDFIRMLDSQYLEKFLRSKYQDLTAVPRRELDFFPSFEGKRRVYYIAQLEIVEDPNAKDPKQNCGIHYLVKAGGIVPFQQFGWDTPENAANDFNKIAWVYAVWNRYKGKYDYDQMPPDMQINAMLFLCEFGQVENIRVVEIKDDVKALYKRIKEYGFKKSLPGNLDKLAKIARRKYLSWMTTTISDEEFDGLKLVVDFEYAIAQLDIKSAQRAFDRLKRYEFSVSVRDYTWSGHQGLEAMEKQLAEIKSTSRSSEDVKLSEILAEHYELCRNAPGQLENLIRRFESKDPFLMPNIMLARCSARAGDFEKALECYQTFLKHSPQVGIMHDDFSFTKRFLVEFIGCLLHGRDYNRVVKIVKDLLKKRFKNERTDLNIWTNRKGILQLVGDLNKREKDMIEKREVMRTSLPDILRLIQFYHQDKYDPEKQFVELERYRLLLRENKGINASVKENALFWKYYTGALLELGQFNRIKEEVEQLIESGDPVFGCREEGDNILVNYLMALYYKDDYITLGTGIKCFIDKASLPKNLSKIDKIHFDWLILRTLIETNNKKLASKKLRRLSLNVSGAGWGHFKKRLVECKSYAE